MDKITIPNAHILTGVEIALDILITKGTNCHFISAIRTHHHPHSRWTTRAEVTIMD